MDLLGIKTECACFAIRMVFQIRTIPAKVILGHCFVLNQLRLVCCEKAGLQRRMHRSENFVIA